MGDRVILHCDLNCFFASVELLSHPDLRDIPTAVCGDPASRHGIILAKNEPAKRLGIQTAETIWQAKKKCPGLVLLPPHHGLYREYSRRVNAIYEQPPLYLYWRQHPAKAGEKQTDHERLQYYDHNMRTR